MESPIVSRQAKRSAQSDLPADTAPVTFAKGSPSPTKTGSARHPAFNTVSAGSSPSDRRYKNILKSPSWRHPAFVHLNGQAEDPFTTSNDAPKSTAQQGRFKVTRIAEILYSPWDAPPQAAIASCRVRIEPISS